MQYRKREMDGNESCQSRLYKKEESALEDQIRLREEALATEQMVFDRIRDYLNKKTNKLVDLNDNQERDREKKVADLEKHVEDINKNKDEDEKEIERMHQLIEQEDDDRRKREKEEQDRQASLERKKKEKLDMEQAARYIQWKWKWY